MLFDAKDHKTLHEAVTHEELLGCSRNVSVVVQDSKTRVARNLGLERNLVTHVTLKLGLLVVEDALRVCTAAERSCEALVTDFIDHFIN